MKWLQTLLSNSNDADEKRLISIVAFIVLIAMVVLNAFEIQIDHTLIYVFAGLAGGTSLLTVLDNFIQK
jgi:hypothetical protein